MDIPADDSNEWQPGIVKSLAEQRFHDDVTIAEMHHPFAARLVDPHDTRIAGKRIMVRLTKYECPVCGQPGCEVEIESARAASPSWGDNGKPMLCKSLIITD